MLHVKEPATSGVYSTASKAKACLESPRQSLQVRLQVWEDAVSLPQKENSYVMCDSKHFDQHSCLGSALKSWNEIITNGNTFYWVIKRDHVIHQKKFTPQMKGQRSRHSWWDSNYSVKRWINTSKKRNKAGEKNKRIAKKKPTFPLIVKQSRKNSRSTNQTPVPLLW